MDAQGLEKRPLWERLGRNIDPTAVAAALESLHVGSAAPVPQGSAAHPPEVGASGSTEAFEQNVGIEQDEDERVQVSAGRAHDESPCENAAPLLSPGILSAATQDPAVPSLIGHRRACSGFRPLSSSSAQISCSSWARAKPLHLGARSC